MRALLDANLLLDAIAAREPFVDDAQQIFLLAARGAIEGVVAAGSITDIYYIARKSLSEADTREALRKLLGLFAVADLRGADCEAALELGMEDYEDAVLLLCGRRANVDCVVTRDAALLRAGCSPPALSPRDFLARVMPDADQHE